MDIDIDIDIYRYKIRAASNIGQKNTSLKKGPPKFHHPLFHLFSICFAYIYIYIYIYMQN